ncbi:hypothetical protein [Bacillus sp. T33-2]|uniref:hypothetical protein n=1 Tax=Bacillus sp. T33-2 TaxID=2054168 RepID=UPI000C78D1DB|nr:hypothetical protein [Bacillus sp. T33-2]PLR95869.1 hypothetical protein CVD19_12620 [Bacillus sp. T33-2]
MSIIYVAIILITVYIATKKNRNPILWMIGSILLPPAAIIAIFIVKPLPKTAAENSEVGINFMNKFDKFTLNKKWFIHYKSPITVIIITGLFAIAGFAFEFLSIGFSRFIKNDAVPEEMVKRFLVDQLQGDEINLQVIAQVASMFSHESDLAGYAFGHLFLQISSKNALIFGFIGFVLSLLLISKNIINKIDISKYSNLSKLFKFFSDQRKDIVLSLVTIWLVGYIFGMAGYYVKQFSIKQDEETYYHEKFKEQYGADRYPEIEPFVNSFLNGDYFFVDGTTLYEAELTKQKTKNFGYLLGIILVFYRYRIKILSKINKIKGYGNKSKSTNVSKNY